MFGTCSQFQAIGFFGFVFWHKFIATVATSELKVTALWQCRIASLLNQIQVMVNFNQIFRLFSTKNKSAVALVKVQVTIFLKHLA